MNSEEGLVSRVQITWDLQTSEIYQLVLLLNGPSIPVEDKILLTEWVFIEVDLIWTIIQITSRTMVGRIKKNLKTQP